MSPPEGDNYRIYGTCYWTPGDTPYGVLTVAERVFLGEALWFFLGIVVMGVLIDGALENHRLRQKVRELSQPAPVSATYYRGPVDATGVTFSSGRSITIRHLGETPASYEAIITR